MYSCWACAHFGEVAAAWTRCLGFGVGVALGARACRPRTGARCLMEPHCALGTLIEGRLRLLDLPWGSVHFGEAAAVRPVAGLWICAAQDARALAHAPGLSARCRPACGRFRPPPFLYRRNYDVVWLRLWVLAALRCPSLSTRAVRPPRQPPVRSSPRSTSPPKTQENSIKYSVTAGLMAFRLFFCCLIMCSTDCSFAKTQPVHDCRDMLLLPEICVVQWCLNFSLSLCTDMCEKACDFVVSSCYRSAPAS